MCSRKYPQKDQSANRTNSTVLCRWSHSKHAWHLTGETIQKEKQKFPQNQH